LPKGRKVEVYYNICVDAYGTEPVYFDQHGVIYTEDKKKLLKFPMSSEIDDYTILPSCTCIAENAFEGDEDCDPECGMYYGGNKLEHLHLPDGLEKIEKYALEGCRHLSEIHLPDNLKEIGEGAFYGCHSLLSITLPLSLEIMGEYALPKNLRVISSNSPNFKILNNCLLTTDNILLWISPEISKLSLPTEVTFNGVECVTYNDCIATKDGVLMWTIPNIKEFNIPSNIRVIGEGAFTHNKEIEELYIPIGVTAINGGAFNCNQKLNSIWLPPTISHIENLKTYQGWGRKYIEFFYPQKIHIPKGMKRHFLDLLPGIPDGFLVEDYK
jgi:hypothetical protein